MNRPEEDILLTLNNDGYSNQRKLSKITGYSLGAVNKAITNLNINGYLTEDNQLTDKALKLIDNSRPQSAIMLAAGIGMRMVPINTEIPKALLEVKGEVLIERVIKQLHEVGVTKIYIVVGFLKEKFDYLIDDYGVELIVNRDYSAKNNLHSLALALPHLSNSYIVPANLYFNESPFNRNELYSWYMVSDMYDESSDVRVNRMQELIKSNGGNTMVGVSYLLAEDAKKLGETISEMDKDPSFDESYWEDALYLEDRMMIPAKVVNSDFSAKINTYEQLRDFDSESSNLRSDAITLCASVFGCDETSISNIQVLKKGMTNRSFLFSVNEEQYIMRIPGEGTDKLINREQEAAVFKAISGLGFCDDPVYINPENGFKVTKFLPGVRTCDSSNTSDLHKAMHKLASFHKMNLQVDHSFDLFGQIEFYESLWNGKVSLYRDYMKTKQRVLSLKPFIEENRHMWCLTHIDAVPDNFLFYQTEEGEQLQLTDWEYAGMQDPHVDIAMFCIYSLYDKEEVDQLIDIYFEEAKEECSCNTRAKIYAYISVCGLLWSNWCEYKAQLGVEFGEYSLKQYRFAKEYYKYALEEMNK